MFDRSWAFWRRVQYGTGFLLCCALIGTGLYYRYLYEAPSCFDGKQNADERGIDCGGACEHICSADVIIPIPLWAESFKIIDGQYNAVAYIENRNREIGSSQLTYTFKFYDDQGLIVERTGTTVIPPDGVYPIFEGRIMTGDRVPTRTEIEFDNNIVWRPGDVGRDQFELERRDLVNADSKPRLTAQLRNTALDEAEDVEIIATIFDSSGNPLTASRAIVEYFPGRTTQEIVFTWPEPIAKTLRSCEVPTDVVLAIDLSGSMNDDGGTPQEPITSVLSSAKSFVSRLGTKDQIGVVTYATNAVVEKMLTNDRATVAEMISALSIDPKEERGSTNTGEALIRISEELNSVRHSDDARRVGILLTDGLATAPREEPENFARANAETLKASGVQLFTIGLGANVNEEFLKSIATSNAQYFKAPSIRELGGIYDSITEAICEDGAAVIEIIPKPKTSFQ